MWQPWLVESARLKYLGLVEALEADIRTGRVLPGDRLPPQRAIAEALDVDLTTVTRAFNEARRRGLVEAQAGRGTFIREDRGGGEGAAPPRPLVDLGMNIPPQPPEADFRRLLSQGVAGVLGSPRGLLSLHYQDSSGAEADRAAAANWLSSRLGPVSADRVVVASGAQGALFAICALMLGRGDAVAAGETTYPGLKAVAAQQGLALVPLAMDEFGLVPAAFERACLEAAASGRPLKLLYLIPSIDNPTTATLPEDRRRALAALARTHGVAIVEDDPYAPLLPKRAAALAEFAGDIVWHVATLSKCATPALRVAYVVAPGAAQASRLAGVLRSTTLMAPPLMSALASRWIADGTLDGLATAIRVENAGRQALATAILGGTAFAADPNGHHLWLHLPAHWRAADFAGHADRAGVSIVPASAFSVAPHPPEAVRISLGVAPDRGALEDGLLQLASLMAEPPLDARAVV